MTDEEIKDEVDKIYTQILASNQRLEEIRSACRHLVTTEMPYCWRPGAFYMTKICDVCGKPIFDLPQ